MVKLIFNVRERASVWRVFCGLSKGKLTMGPDLYCGE